MARDTSRVIAFNPSCDGQNGSYGVTAPVELLTSQRLVWSAGKKTEWRVIIYGN
ncbi:MAG: hypothetical protein ACYCWN_09870 [Ferrimicrobium sp.]|jgi:hypothetical protein|uniref:Uncharacterized protein n=1 Tax=Ferrimicrobium acidiphilum TaxID=121039 RepID=A0ABV3Y439_9ACTN|nr:hypothetical protein [Ferrimicrobium sp.]